MPALPAQPGVFEVKFHFTIGNDANAVVRSFFKYTGTVFTNSQALAVATAIRALAATNLPAVMGVDTTLTDVSVQDLSTSTAGFGVDSGSTAGTRGGGLLSAGTATLISSTIARRYRGGKPRTYWPLLTSDDVLDTQNWKTASVNDVQTAYNAIYSGIDALTTGGISAVANVNVSYYEGFTSVLNPITGRTRDVPKVRSVAIAPDVVLTSAVQQRIASQRRRNLTR